MTNRYTHTVQRGPESRIGLYVGTNAVGSHTAHGRVAWESPLS